MWIKTVNELSFSRQSVIDVIAHVTSCLRSNLSPEGSYACELLSKKELQGCGLVPFKYTADELNKQIKNKVTKFLNSQDLQVTLQNIADSIIMDCTLLVNHKKERRSNYHDTCIEEILHMIDERLQYNDDVTGDSEFEVRLKQHICGFAARKFQRMHEDFIHELSLCLLDSST